MIDRAALNPASVALTYVGFFDVLGFARRVLDNFDEALATYNELVRLARFSALTEARPNLRLKILSDSIVAESPSLADVVVAANLLQFAALAGQNCLFRGGIGHGRHVESHSDGNLFVVSEPLVRAVAVEKTVRHPCVALDSGIIPSPRLWLPYERNIERPLLFYGERWIVNPMGLFWGASAATRVALLSEEFPDHSDKFSWFLELHSRVFDPAPLIPTPEQWTALGGLLDENRVPRVPTAKP